MKNKGLLKLQREHGELIPIIYVKGKQQFLEKPKRARVKKYLFDKEEQVIIGKIRKSIWWLNLIFILILLVILLQVYRYPTDVIDISYSKKITYQEGVISLNIINEDTSTKEVFVSLQKGEETILDHIKLEVGEGIGGLEIDHLALEEGSYPMELMIAVNTKYGSKRNTYDVVLLVE